MIKIIKNIIIIALTVIAVDRVFTYTFTNEIFKKTISGESGGTINYVINNKKTLDFLILGASRARHGIDTEKLQSLGNNGYNLGINGASALNSLLILDILLQNNVKPKTVLLQADLFDFGDDTQEKTIDQVKRVYQYDTPLIREYVKRIGKTEEIKYFFGLYKFNRKIINITFNFFKRNSIKDEKGFVGLPISEDKIDDTVVSRKYHYDKNGLSFEAVKKMQKICEKNKIKFIVVFPPSYANTSYNEKEQLRLLKALEDEKINFINMSNINKYAELKSESNWKDGLHLNYIGAEIFSKLLNDQLNLYFTKK